MSRCTAGYRGLALLILAFGIFSIAIIYHFLLADVVHKPPPSRIIPYMRTALLPRSTARGEAVINATGGYTGKRCQLKRRDVSVYMDAFTWLDRYWYTGKYMTWALRSRMCDPLPAGGGRCLFNFNDPLSTAILYSGAYNELNFSRTHKDQVLIAFTTESENGPFCNFGSAKYDLKISYGTDADVSYPFICEANHYNMLLDMGQPNVPINRKGIVSFISNCNSTYRNQYVLALSKYVSIDHWGKCFNTQGVHFTASRVRAEWESGVHSVLKRKNYKFIISFENTVEKDYVTEKVYHGLLTGAIPIYYGDSAVFNYIPSNNSIIYAPHYTPAQLVRLIDSINADEELYASFFANWDMEKIKRIGESYCQPHFTCKTCQKILELQNYICEH